MTTFLIVGLGNPGKEYEKTRHNLGFMAIDALAEKFDVLNDFKEKKDFKSLFVTTTYEETKLIIAKPQTYMNLSGQAVQKILSFFQIDLQNLLIVHDDLDLELGTIRFSHDSGPAGHNGIKSIIESLGTKNFTRLRLGIKQEAPAGIPSEDFVLQKFTAQENNIIQEKLPTITEAIEFFVQNGFERAASEYNQSK